ncbi:bifunctional DNA-formamidopyrimidine glycosylase/DNA-(apurinic or apyrimidinic site) lyase [Candidatus Uhrbacteria bacterium]|nr:bifunctional DNA-formamidopyrimidine glycosylase/DNA-(apurinic or apyrimidinic site) lyase [Candidatus Uhrbacteria bacterium]
MPELPEVETVRRQLDERLRDSSIVSVHIFQMGREFPSGKKLIDALVGKRILHISRRAKLLLWDFTDGMTMSAHLKMTGRFVFVDEHVKNGKHDRILFELQHPLYGRQFVMWSDVRKFGYISVLSKKEREEIVSSYGPEPLTTSVEKLADCFVLPKTRKIKSAILDQKTIAGVGNIYADEALFRAGILPMRTLGDISASERLSLAKNIIEILEESLLQQGTSSHDYVDTQGKKGGFLDFLRVYGREGEACRTCAEPISKIILNQRGTHFCRRCQK